VDWDGTLYGMSRGRTSLKAFGVTPDNQYFWHGDEPGSGPNPPDGACYGRALIAGWDGRFYGATYDGGASNVGSIFSVESDLQTNYVTLHEFSSQPDGAYPSGPLVQADDGNFYGMTTWGRGLWERHGLSTDAGWYAEHDL
jgi:uncharacterized repeat protein (TIGR03803 family)